MKTVSQLFSAAALTLVICIITFAGEMWTPGIVYPPPPDSEKAAISTSKPEVTPLDTLSETAVLLLKSMLLLF